MTDQLSLYNGALALLGQRKLASLASTDEGRPYLDDAWNEGAVNACLEEGQWNFATRTLMLQSNPAIEPDFGFQRAFDKPADWIRTVGLASDGYFRCRLNDEGAKDEGDYWYADVDPIYARIVSNDSSYGNDLSRWPMSFVNFVESYLALKICPRITKVANQRDAIAKVYQKALLKARGKDAMNEGTAFPPMGGWSSARRGGRSRLDRGSRGSLTG